MKISMAVPLVGFASTGGVPAPPITLSCTYTGAVQTWVAPLDVVAVSVTMTGGGGGGNIYRGGGSGGTVSGTLAITPGSTYSIYVAGGGGGVTSGSLVFGAGGFGGGGAGGAAPSGYPGTGGGGASYILNSGGGLLVAVGGGGGITGANAQPAGNGGGLIGGSGTYGGGGGTQSAGGAGLSSGGSGGYLQGQAGWSTTNGQGEGGGGGGFYGGGEGAGGGGGSSYVGGLTGTIVNTQGTGGAGGSSSGGNGANGTVTITYIGASQLVFSSTGANQTWTAPTGVTSVNVTLKGANGGWDGNAGGSGGLVSGTLAVSAGSSYILVVGSSGGQLEQTYYGGGGSPRWAGGGGGGRSAIRNVANTADLVTAGGAGGGSENSVGAVGGAGGGLTGGTGGGTGGGAGGGQAGGGSGVQYVGANAVGTPNRAAGGGGWYGGANGGTSGGGGGGSSYVANLTGTVVNTQGANYAAGQIIIAYPNIITFLPTMLTSNVYWFDAADTATITTSGSTVTAWANKGTASMTFNANTGTVSSGTTTKNGRNVVSFPTSSKLVSAATNLGITGNDETLFVVYQKRANIPTVNTGIDFMTANNPNPAGNPNGFNLYYNGINNGNDLHANTSNYDRFWTICGGYCFTSQGNTPTYSPFVYQLLSLAVSQTSPGFWSFGGNNNGVGSGPGQRFAGCGDAYFTTTMTFNMGAATVDWDMAEYIVYNRVLTNVERQQIEGYLAWKWNIPLVASHPYANYQP